LIIKTKGRTKMRAALALQDDQYQQIRDFMSGFSLETTPGSAAKIPDFRNHVRRGDSVYITFLHGADFNDTIQVAARLRREGFNPVPHIAARSIPGQAFLEEGLKRLRDDAEVSQVLLIAGAVAKPLGEFRDTMQVLETGLLDKYGVTKIGVSGHPEGSPDIPDEAIKRALRWKNDFARRSNAQFYLVTQFCFEPEPIIQWDKRIQADGNTLPIYIGIPGLATLKTLLAHAKACGIGPSMRVISRQAMNVAKLLTVAAPDRLVTALASYQANNPACGIRGVHMYPLGGLKKSADWSYAVADGNFWVHPDGKGFSVDVPT
jgi:methylenetetrahydrofolate reductase (NADPH)